MVTNCSFSPQIVPKEAFIRYQRKNKKHRKPLRCHLFVVAGDERVELPSAVLETAVLAIKLIP
jgi:hypothetical protein